MKRWQIAVSAAVVLAIVAGAGYLGVHTSNAADQTPQAPPTVAVTRGNVEQSVDAPGSLFATQEINLAMGVSGTLQSVAVRPGEAVKQGQVLATIGNREQYEGALANAKIQVLQAQQALDDLMNNAPQDAAQAKLNFLTAQQNLQDAQNARTALNYPRVTADRLKELQNNYEADLQAVAKAQDAFDKVSKRPPDDPSYISALRALTAAQTQKDQDLATLNFVSSKPTQDEIDTADANLAKAQAAYNSALATYNAVQNGKPDPAKLALDQATLDAANSQLAQAQANLNDLELKAPFDGVVLAVSAQAGDVVSGSTPVIDLYAPDAVEVVGTVTEEDYPVVKPGMKATLYFDAQPNLEVKGTVQAVVPDRQSGSQTQALYPVYIKMDQVPAGLAPGMTVDAQIVIASKDNVLVLPRAIVHARADNTATVQVWANDHIETRNIKVGLRGDQNIEIVSGLSLGDLVVSQ